MKPYLVIPAALVLAVAASGSPLPDKGGTEIAVDHARPMMIIASATARYAVPAGQQGFPPCADADFDGNTFLTAVDFSLLLKAFVIDPMILDPANAKFDLDGNGRLGASDAGIWLFLFVHCVCPC